AIASSLLSSPARICTSLSRSKFVAASGVANWSGERARRTVTRTSFARWRAATRPSPPLFPVPQRTRTFFPSAPNSDRATSALAFVPLAWFLGLATEELGKQAGPGVGGLLNATFGNATELIIAIFALSRGLTEVVKASLTGSIVGNLLLVLGLSMLAGGVKYKVQHFSREASGIQITMLVVAVIGLVMPALYVLSTGIRSGVTLEEMSLGIAGILLLAY